jgi:hypothetical protein
LAFSTYYAKMCKDDREEEYKTKDYKIILSEEREAS